MGRRGRSCRCRRPSWSDWLDRPRRPFRTHRRDRDRDRDRDRSERRRDRDEWDTLLTPRRYYGYNLAVNGVFDECQDVVKKVNADAAYKAQHRIGAVNSINWARVAAQVVYYFKGYFAATKDDREQVAFAVPSGNFGNIFAGYVAKRMGLPIRRLVLATNENDVLDRFFRTGKYRITKKVTHTTSPSMDISKASNFERYVFDLVGRDPSRVKDLWRRLEGSNAAEGEFDLSHSPYWVRVAQSGFVSGRSTHAERISTIRMIFEKYRVMIDPHTADGVKVGLEHRETGVPLICLETALPVKFADTLRAAAMRAPSSIRSSIPGRARW